MNSLSWFLYATDVVGSLNAATFAVAAASGVGMGVAVMWASFVIIDARTREEENKVREARGLWLWRLAILCIASGFLSCLFPSKNTMYAIAASEVGEKIAKSEAVQEMASDATKALQQWIKKQIEPEAKK
jgi:hypothetical protein